LLEKNVEAFAWVGNERRGPVAPQPAHRIREDRGRLLAAVRPGAPDVADVAT
jgi:hypothetical protein